MVGRKGSDSDIKFLSIKNTHNEVNLLFESERENRTIASSDSATHRNRLLFEEMLETGFKGFVYHPNLVTFDIGLENGLGQRKEKFQPALIGQVKNNSLNRFHIRSLFLRQKPYAFRLSADKSRQIDNRDFFERQIIDHTAYGGDFGLRNDYIPANLSFNNSMRTIDRANRPSQEFQDDEISLSLSSDSEITGETRFDFTRDRFSRLETGTPDQKGISKGFNLINQKYLFDEKNLLSSFLQYYDLTGTNNSSILSLNEGLYIEHTDSLDSSYNYNFSDRASSGTETKDNRINANLRHRLYESLISSLNGYYFNSDSTTFSQDSYGLSLSEDYIKRLGEIGRLRAGLGLSYEQEDRKSPDNIISIIDEPHTLTTGVVALLDKPRVELATVVVTNSNGSTTFTLNIDYQLVAAGERTQIQRIATGSISNGQTVLVDYQAKTGPSFKFNTVGKNYRLRIDFLDDLVGVFYNLEKEAHPDISGEENAILQRLADTTFGLDVNYKNFGIELENEDYNSNLSPFKSLRLRESCFFNSTGISTLTFQSSQSKIRLINSQQTQRFFDFISRYSIRLNLYTRFSSEVGLRWQEGSGVDLDEVSARSRLELNMGRFLMSAEYDFERQMFLGDSLVSHFFITRIKRKF